MLVREINKDGKEIILVGTAHISRKSEELVKETIEKYNPEIIGVELDYARLKQLRSGEKWRETNVVQVIKTGQTYLFLINLLLSNLQKKIGKTIGIKTGSDMISAVEEAETRKIRIALLDRDIRITMKRAVAKATLVEKLKLFYSMSLMIFGAKKEKIDEARIEQMKKKDVMTELMEEFSRELPSLKEVLVDERDLYIADRIQRCPAKKIVAVVGAGHLDGIEKNIIEGRKAVGLDVVPKKKNYIKIIKYLIPLLFIVLIGTIFLTKDFSMGVNAILVWFAVNGVLSAFGVLIARGHPLSILAAFLAAPFTSLHPFFAAGWFAALAEAKVRVPKVKDIEELPEIDSYSKLVKNNATRIIMVGALANLGSTIGTIVAFPYIATLLL